MKSWKLMDSVCVPSQNSYVEALTLMWQYLVMEPQGMQLRLNDVIKVGPWLDRMSVLIRRNSRELTLPLHMWGHSVMMAVYKSDKRTQNETCLAGTLILDFPASRAMRKLICIASTIQSGILLRQLLQTETEAMDKWPLL